MSKVFHGTCLCEMVEIQLNGQPESVYLCYCKDCRKNSGNLGQMNAGYKEENVTIIDPEHHVGEYVVTRTHSGKPKHKFFCRNCGCTLRTICENSPGNTYVRITLLDDADKTFEPKYELNKSDTEQFTCGVKSKFYCNI